VLHGFTTCTNHFPNSIVYITIPQNRKPSSLVNGWLWGDDYQLSTQSTRSLEADGRTSPSRSWLVKTIIVSQIWLWINTYENTIFRGLFTSINPSYDLMWTEGVLLVLTHCHILEDIQIKGHGGEDHHLLGFYFWIWATFKVGKWSSTKITKKLWFTGNHDQWPR